MFLSELTSMEPEERVGFFSADIAFETLQIAVDSIWSTELTTDPSSRDWNAVLALLTEVDETSRLPGAELLGLVARRARSVVLAEQLGRVDDAIRTLDD